MSDALAAVGRSTVVLSPAPPERRFGMKGGQAPAFLAALGIAVPTRFNHATAVDGLLVARLAATEFFIEAPGDAPLAAAAAGAVQDALAGAQAEGRAGVYPVMREDRAFVVGGPLARDLLVQVCNVDFTDLLHADGASPERPLVMTSMAGVSVLAIPDDGALRLWCDPTFGDWLWATLAGIVNDMGGTVNAPAA
jgi:sarcosine oxidase subunit gamma